MIDGAWTTDGPDLGPGDRPARHLVPAGAVVRFRTRGPTRFAVENDRGDETGGVVWVAPPAAGGGPPGPWAAPSGPGDPVPATDAVFRVWRWDESAAADPAHSPFAELGAAVGSVFLTVLVPAAEQEWVLWFRRPDTLVGREVIDTASGDVRLAAQTWRRSPE